MQVGITYSEPTQQFWLNFDVPEGATVREAIERSGVLKQFPQIDLSAQKVGIFSKVVKLDAPLRAGDRVEIYRPITCDPQTVPRRDTADEDE
jgi:putative ubiquitin-RnfH superfamily antitoxin RatB of RatAB toxin-antitoxin module